jgi:stearoyl-CoA desaturase (delta-9 desaturase)
MSSPDHLGPAIAPISHPCPLRRPSSTRPTLVLLRYFLPLIVVHAAALLAAIPSLFSWSALLICLVGVHVFGQAITMGYHRLLTHRSFTAPRWFEHGLVVLALCCLEDSPARWVATHRQHHVHSDEDDDPHSPLVTLLWGHMGWLFLRNRELHQWSTYERYAKDVLRDPFYLWLEKHPTSPLWFYLGQCAAFLAAALALALPWMEWSAALRFAAGVLVWGVFVRTVLVWHITWSVNSLTHLFGYQNHSTGENSRNNWLVALVAAGEGWHNNHHHDPSCCSVQHTWWELDVTYWEVRALKALGIVRDIVPRREARAQEARHAARAEVTSRDASPADRTPPSDRCPDASTAAAAPRGAPAASDPGG